MTDEKVQIVIRLTEAEREQVKELASKEKKSMNQYVLEKALATTDSKDSGTDSTSDITITMLLEQLATKDNQIAELQKLLDQQQRITLAQAGEKESLRIELKEKSDKKNFFQRLFNL